MEYITILILTALFILREILSFRERKDLLDRLMARSFEEYKDNTHPEVNDYGEPEDEDVISIDEAKEEING